MKVFTIINSDSLAIPTIFFLQQKDFSVEVGILSKNKWVLLPQLLSIGITEDKIQLFEQPSWKSTMKDWLNKANVDAVFVFGFPYKIPSTILGIPKFGFFNFHYGALPKYKGADPIFWQLKNKEENCKIVVHQMTSNIDAGPIIWSKSISIIPGENYAMICERLGAETAKSIVVLTELIKKYTFEESTNEHHHHSNYFQKPCLNDLTINWDEQQAEDIEWLVNATNPKYGGAITYLDGREFRILEVAPVQMDQAVSHTPGYVVYADNLYGLIVACKNKQFLRIGVAHLKEGYFSGTKLFNIGVKAGVKFN